MGKAVARHAHEVRLRRRAEVRIVHGCSCRAGQGRAGQGVEGGRGDHRLCKRKLDLHSASNLPAVSWVVRS